MIQATQSRHGLEPVYADVLFLLGYALLYMFILAVLRGILLFANIDLAGNTPIVDLARSFLVGARFDLMITCMIAAPLLPGLLFPGGLGKRKLAILWLASAAAITLFAGVVEPEFYREFHTRLNSIAFRMYGWHNH